MRRSGVQLPSAPLTPCPARGFFVVAQPRARQSPAWIVMRDAFIWPATVPTVEHIRSREIRAARSATPNHIYFVLTKQNNLSIVYPMIKHAVATVLDCYPQIFFACHRTHVRDERTKRLLSSRQAAVLDHLETLAPTHLDVLSSHLGVTASSVSLMIDRLEKAGYVRRSRDTHDARRVSLRLTTAGARVSRQQKILDPSLVEAMLRCLPAGERELALAGLKSLARAANQLAVSGQLKHLRQKARA